MVFLLRGCQWTEVTQPYGWCSIHSHFLFTWCVSLQRLVEGLYTSFADLFCQVSCHSRQITHSKQNAETFFYLTAMNTASSALFQLFWVSVWFCRFCCIMRTIPPDFQGTWPHPCWVSSRALLIVYNALVQVGRKWTRVRVVAENMSIYDLEVHGENEKSQRFCSLIHDTGFHWAWTHTCCTNRNDHSIAGVIGHDVALLLVWKEQDGDKDRLRSLYPSAWLVKDICCTHLYICTSDEIPEHMLG